MNHLDEKYLTDFEKEEIKKFKNIFYIGHKAYQRKVQLPSNLVSLRQI